MSNLEFNDIIDHFTSEYEILTPSGFIPFDGIRCHPKSYGVILSLSDDTKFTCTKEHILVSSDGKEVAAQDSIGISFDKNETIVTVTEIKDDPTQQNYFDILNIHSDEHTFISSVLTSHNCEFIGSVSTLIDSNFLKKMVPEEPLSIPNIPETMRIYELPKPEIWMEAKGYEYAACIDSGYGVKQDSSVLKIYLVKKNTNLHLVAQLSTNDMEIRIFSEKARKLLKKYNDPRLIIEMNGPGIACMDYFHYEAEYENLVHFDPKGRMRGLYAGNSIRDMAVILLKTYVQRKMVKDFDEDTIKELYSFGKTSKDKWGAMSGNHDDHVMCMMWVIFYVNSNLFYGNKDEKDVSAMEQDEIILDTPENREIEADAFRRLKDRDYQNAELAKYAEHNPYTDDDEVKNEGNDEDYEPPMAMRN